MKSTFLVNYGFRRFVTHAAVLSIVIILLYLSKEHLETELLSKLSKLVSLPVENVTTVTCPPLPSPPEKFRYEDFACYQLPQNVSEVDDLLEDIMESDRKPSKGNTIFFVEASCGFNGEINLNPRQACAIESAARTNLNRDIFVLIVTPVGYPTGDTNAAKIVNVLRKYPNIFFRNTNIPMLVENTPAHKWILTGDLFESKHIKEHVSDFLRLLLLFMFGGTYFDLDFVILRNLDPLPSNFFGNEHDDMTGNSVIDFSHDSIGHEMANVFLHEFMENFNGGSWSHNGPHLMKRLSERICGTQDHTKKTRDRCIGFEVHQRPVFYPVGAVHWWEWFSSSPNHTEFLLENSKDAFSVHTWNSHRRRKDIKNERNSAYYVLGERFCPKVNAVGWQDF